MSTTTIADLLPSGIERSEDFDCDIHTGIGMRIAEAEWDDAEGADIPKQAVS